MSTISARSTTHQNRSRTGLPSLMRGMLRQFPAHLVLILTVVVSLMPFIWMALASFKTYGDLVANPGWPNPVTLDNYAQIWMRAGFPQAILNSVMVALPRVIFGCLTSAAVAFVLAKYHFPGRDALFTVIISTMMIPFAVLLVPLYVTLADLRMVNNLSGLIAFGLFNTFGIFLLRQSIRGIPDELLEAARIDGAGEGWIFTRIILPLSGAPLAALAVVTFLNSWDDYLLPSIVLTNPAIKTLPLVLSGLRSLFWDRYELFAAGSMLTVVPVMVLYAMLQKQFVRGIAMTGLNK